MKSKHIVILAFIFIVLILLLFTKKIFLKPDVYEVEYEKLELSLDIPAVGAIEIKKPHSEDSLRLEKINGRWVVPSKWNAKVKKDRIESFLKEMNSLWGELRSSSNEIFSDYGIGKNEAYSLTFYDSAGNEKECLLIGTKKTDFGKSFLRKSKSSDVYLIDKDIFSLLSIYGDPKKTVLNEKVWIDFSLLDFDPDAIKAIKIKKIEKNKQITLVDLAAVFDEEKRKKWKSQSDESNFPIDVDKVNSFLRKLKAVTATDILDPNAEGYGFDKPYLTLDLKGTDSCYTLLVGKVKDEQSKDRYVKDSDSYVYLLPKHHVEKIDVDISEFYEQEK